MKIGIIGMGHVGSALAYALVLKGLCNHLVLVSRDESKARGDALDLEHTLAFCERPMIIEGTTLEYVVDCDIVVITVSAVMTAKMKSRMDLAEANIPIFRKIIPAITAANPNAILMIITNPVDVMTYLAAQLSPLPHSKVMGVGTLVDSARFRTLLSKAEQIHPDDLRAYILGEHGPSQFPVFSHALAGGEPIEDNSEHRLIYEEVSKAGFEVYGLKGYTNYAIATAACTVIQAIVYDEHRTMPLSTCFNEWQGIQDNCFSIPVVVGRAGIIRYLQPEMNLQEKASLNEVARVIKQSITGLLESSSNSGSL
ncbi:MAG: NAD(P)-binding domain-containing protein [Methylicorpusculum sp.]|nr:NAD(P)-binding domain-containing protein [Methylicorpusculum sp.]